MIPWNCWKDGSSSKCPRTHHTAPLCVSYKELCNVLVPAEWYIDTQAPITTADSEPEPDVVVVRGDTRQYLDRHPGPQDLALVIEVADTTSLRDQTIERRLYARAGIPVYWIANLPESKFEVYTNPSGPGEQPDYRQHRDYGPTDEIPIVIEGVEIGRIAVRELLP